MPGKASPQPGSARARADPPSPRGSSRRPWLPIRSWPRTEGYQFRYQAACVAALASCSEGKDEPPPDHPARARLRGQALDWLKAEMDAWAKELGADDAKARPTVRRTLQHWQADPALAGVRDGGALARLPEAERAGWRALWEKVVRLLKELEKEP